LKLYFKNLLSNSSLKASIFSNYFGTLWSALISIFSIPLYLKLIGPDGYGIVGIFTSLQVLFSLLDAGLSTTLNKELSRLSVLKDSKEEMHNVVKTLGDIYWYISLSAGIFFLLLSPLISKYWVHSNSLSFTTISLSFALLSTSLIFQLPIGFYSGGIIAIQKQVTLNIFRIIFATIKSFGSILVLIFISKSVTTFLFWILIVNIAQVFTLKYILWLNLPKITSHFKKSFQLSLLRKNWNFAAGLTAITLTSVLLTQVDTIILSKILPLNEFGYYSLSYTVASFLYMIVSPVSQSYFPKFCILVTENNTIKLANVYHEACQLVTLAVVPIALFLSIFSSEIMLIWTKNEITVQNTHLLVSIVTMAVCIHCLMFIPYMVCLAYNYTKLALYSNIIILILMIPSTIYFTMKFGSIGGAFCWLFINIIYFFSNPIFVHKKFLTNHLVNWYWDDTIKPIIACLSLFVFFKLFIYHNYFTNYKFILLIIIGLFGFILTIFSSSRLKNIFLNLIYKIKLNPF
jgi:O-antigen/teichoic acid export membrane protein